MAGLYIHIPFCKQACHYCDFHFSTNSDKAPEMVKMICEELIMRQKYLPVESKIETIYFGGGTPSMLHLEHIQMILNTIYKHYPLDLQEVTLEANPDDLDQDKLKGLLNLGIGRLSLGIQSFQDEVLSFYNRSHNAAESLQAIDRARSSGFDKLSMDLIYGYPSSNHDLWKGDLNTAIKLNPDHISSYCLTIEPKTALGKWRDIGKFKPASEDFLAEQYEILQEAMEVSGYQQYEISNFAKPGAFALHNCGYWKNIPYLGIGPSAHSYNGEHRGHNPANNVKYMKAIKENIIPFHTDLLSPSDIINEYILTSLRTIWGVNSLYLKEKFGLDLILTKTKELDAYQSQGMLMVHEHQITLTNKGKLLADYLAAKLFV